MTTSTERNRRWRVRRRLGIGKTPMQHFADAMEILHAKEDRARLLGQRLFSAQERYRIVMQILGKRGVRTQIREFNASQISAQEDNAA
jgi:hypothetical protein